MPRAFDGRRTTTPGCGFRIGECRDGPQLLFNVLVTDIVPSGLAIKETVPNDFVCHKVGGISS